jgi:hypothetical protein
VSLRDTDMSESPHGKTNQVKTSHVVASTLLSRNLYRLKERRGQKKLVIPKQTS